jgi:hypothetical protein
MKNFVLGTMIAAVAAVGGLALGNSHAGASGFGVYQRVTTASTNLSSSGSPVVLKSVSVPPGNWIVHAKANPVNFGAADYVRCQIMVGGTQRDAGATLVGNAAPGPTGETGPSVATIALQSAVHTAATRTFTLQCLHDFAQSGEYVDPGAAILVEAAPGPIG